MYACFKITDKKVQKLKATEIKRQQIVYVKKSANAVLRGMEHEELQVTIGIQCSTFTPTSLIRLCIYTTKWSKDESAMRWMSVTFVLLWHS